MAEHNYDTILGYTAIVYPGRKYFDRHSSLQKQIMMQWAVDNFGKENVIADGVTKLSWRFYFVNEADALVFRLKFGI